MKISVDEPVEVVDATPASLNSSILTDDQTGIFRHVPEPVSARVLAESKIASFRKGNVLFHAGQPVVGMDPDGRDVSIPIYVILEGQFFVSHNLLEGPPNAEGEIEDLDEPGVLLADVEYLALGLDQAEHGRGNQDLAFSTVKCFSPAGRALLIPQGILNDLIRDGLASQLMFNVARSLSLKMLRRAAAKERRYRSQRATVILHLRHLVERHKTVASDRSGLLPVMLDTVSISQQDIVRGVIARNPGYGISPPTIRAILNTLISNDRLLLDGHRMEMSSQFLQTLMERTDILINEVR